MTYARVTKFQAKDGTLHDSEDGARSHDQARRRDRLREEAIKEIGNVLWAKVQGFNDLPEDSWTQASQKSIAEGVFDGWKEISAAIAEAGRS